MKSIRAALAALVLVLHSPASAEERISHFWSDVRIQKDSSVEVTETIDVNAEHDRINHGIYRDFPTRYRGPHGSQVRIGFTFRDATLDGTPVQASTEDGCCPWGPFNPSSPRSASARCRYRVSTTCMACPVPACSVQR